MSCMLTVLNKIQPTKKPPKNAFQNMTKKGKLQYNVIKFEIRCHRNKATKFYNMTLNEVYKIAFHILDLYAIHTYKLYY